MSPADLPPIGHDYIILWEFHNAPKSLRAMSPFYGDEDWIALLPGEYAYEWDDESVEVPRWMGPRGFAICDTAEYRLDDGRCVVIGAHA